MITTFASTYGGLLAASRVPYAAALDDEFFPVFGRLHPRGRFPYVSLLVVGLLTIPACFFTLGDVISFLTAGLVLIQAIAQIVALFILRKREGDAPFRMWLFPIPAIIALLAWAFIFYSSGNAAMLYGALTLLAGVVAYLITARLQQRWPFLAAVVVLGICCFCAHPANAAPFGSSRIVMRGDHPVFTVDRKPFFVYGAAFFYERVPRTLWRKSLIAYRELGINTIDLYLIWNWHEVSDGQFDFTGSTNPRRDLSGLLQLIHELGFRTIIRPGPVIRNEWRNGGYPAWLLERPEYNMPLHDVLEGRYPATATLQNAHSDQAAAEWMANATHLRYADRWLRRAITEVRPWGGDVLAIALDDDQGAYLNNQTWPAPNLHAYLHHLAKTVRSIAGNSVPLFINTYQMKVTASAPVWAWGNWYQSAAYHLGEHDRRELEFSTALLATQPQFPIMQSEFQAGWLQGPDEAHPRRVFAQNTELALHTLLQEGARGIVNFPVQDTIYPSGWEAPFANASYAWDAALTVALGHNARYSPTMDFGRLISTYGPLLAQTHRVADAAIAYTVSAYDAAQIDGSRLDLLVTATRDALTDCRTLRLTCDLVDLGYVADRDLQRYRYLVVPRPAIGLTFTTPVTAKLQWFARRGRVVPSVVDVHQKARAVNISDAVLSVSDGARPFGFLDIVNYDSHSRLTGPIRVQLTPQMDVRLPSVRIAPASAVLIPINVRPRALTPGGVVSPPALPQRCDGIHWINFAGVCWPMPPQHGPATRPTVRAYFADVMQDGEPWIVLQNGAATLGISPMAGARAFVFQSGHDNAFTTTGGLRDDVDPSPPPSPRDYIAAYTHQFPPGTFNRSYDCQINGAGAAACAYSAPDLEARFQREITMQPEAPAFTLRLRMTSTRTDRRGVLLNAFAVPRADRAGAQLLAPAPTRYTIGTSIAVQGNAFGVFDTALRRIATACWPPQQPLGASVVQKPDTVLAKITYPSGAWYDVRFGDYPAASVADAERILTSLKGRQCADSNRR
ncbi:MAG: beta-galactosidase [Candidatus Eremiobacteraeota bacterium]|nr:beta-galactosidase [Candidatus Eremiobacteraeota bacterium]